MRARVDLAEVKNTSGVLLDARPGIAIQKIVSVRKEKIINGEVQHIYELEAQLVAHKNAEPSVIRVGQSLELPQVTVIGSLEITLLDPIFMRI